MSYSSVGGGCFVHASFHWKSALLKHQHAHWLGLVDLYSILSNESPPQNASNQFHQKVS